MNEIARLAEGYLDQLMALGAPLGASAEDLGFSLTVHARDAPPLRLRHREDVAFYPCSVVKIFWMVFCLSEIAEGHVEAHDELDRALRDMIAWSSNTATNYVIDSVTGTTGDTLLDGDAYSDWVRARQAGNRWFRARNWPGMEGINLCQKNMDDDRYGRERQFIGVARDNHNHLTTASVARLLDEVFVGTDLPEEVRDKSRALMARRHDPDWVAANPNAQVRGYFGANLPAEARLWSKAGWTGWTGDPLASFRRHDCAWIEMPGLPPFSLVVFTQGRIISESVTFLPAAAEAALRLVGALVS